MCRLRAGLEEGAEGSGRPGKSQASSSSHTSPDSMECNLVSFPLPFQEAVEHGKVTLALHTEMPMKQEGTDNFIIVCGTGTNAVPGTEIVCHISQELVN